MIFVTVGTHEQQFDRLIRCVDELKKTSIIKEDVIIQTGFSQYQPQYCESSKLFPYEKMLQLVQEASIVITHGGPSSFIMPLQIKKTPIVVPRRKEFEEHVNDHQLEFCKEVETRQKNIIVVEDVDKLGDVITNYREIVLSMNDGIQSNNAIFCEKFEEIVDSLVKRTGKKHG